MTTGYGSSQVIAPVRLVPPGGHPASGREPQCASATSTAGAPPASAAAGPAAFLTPASGSGHGLTLTLTQTDPDTGPPSVEAVEPTVDISISAPIRPAHLLPGAPPRLPRGADPESPPVLSHRPLGGRPTSPTRSRVVLPSGWSDVIGPVDGTLTPPRTGLYTLSLQGSGAASLTLDGQPAVSDTLSHARGRWSQTVPLVGGHPYRVDLAWEPVDQVDPVRRVDARPSTLTLGLGVRQRPDRRRRRRRTPGQVRPSSSPATTTPRPSTGRPWPCPATRTPSSRRWPPPTPTPWWSSTPVARCSCRGWDRWPGCSRPGTRARRTVAAIAALLFGDVDPSGRLPVTFPTTDTTTAVSTPAQWPGIDLTSTYTEGLDVGYRYDHATGTQPLFPFGYGLSYTRFALGAPLPSPAPDPGTPRAYGSPTPARGPGPTSSRPI